MLKRNIVIILALLLVTCCFLSCQKEVINTFNQSVSELLTSHKWHWFRVGMTYNDSTVTWDPAFSDPCEKDNFFEFKPDGSLLIDEGPTKCNQDDQQTIFNGGWEASLNNIIKLSNGSQFEIISITESSLVLIEMDDHYPHVVWDLIP